MEQPIYSKAGDVAYLEGSATVISFGKSAAGKKPTGEVPSTPVVKNFEGISGTGKVAPWGDDNLFPQHVIEDYEKNSIIGPTLDWKARALYSMGIDTYKVIERKANGEEVLEHYPYQPWIDFAKASNIKRYLIEACSDFYIFYNFFPELVLSKDRKTITNITCQEASYCRWEIQDENTGAINHCYINASWDESQTVESKNTKSIPVLDPYFDPVNALRERKDGYKYIYPVSYPTPGKTYYQLAHWNAIRKSGWLDVATAIPEFKKSLMKNSLNIKYHVQIADFYWEWKFPEWKKMTADDRKKAREIVLKEFNEFMSGPKNSGKSLVSMFKNDPVTGKEYPGWKVETIDDKLKDGAYIEDSQEASTHILYALGVDQSLSGSAPGKGMGGGSGSDKNAAFNIYISLVKIHEDLILEPLEFIRDYNNWPSDMVFRFRRPFLTTLNNVTPSQRTPGNGAIQ